MKIPMKLVCEYMLIFFNFSLTSNHLHSLQVENCDSNSRLVVDEVDEDDNGKFRLEGLTNNINPLEVAGRNSDTQFQVGKNKNLIT